MSFLTLHYGQCGNQIGEALYSTIFEDIKNDNQTPYFHDSRRKWFNIQPDGKLEARCISLDTENKVTFSRKQTLYAFKNVVGGHSGGSENNWAFGYNCQSEEMVDSVLEAVRKEIEKRNITTFMNIFSSSGGTGSGIGSRIIQELRNTYPEKIITNAIILPYLNGDINTQNYNTVLSLAKIHSLTDTSIIFENDKLYDVCSSKIRDNINFIDLNKVISFQLASVFQPLTVADNYFIINQLTSHDLLKYVQLKSSFPVSKYYKYESGQTWKNKLYFLIKQYDHLKSQSDTLQINKKIISSVAITRGKDKPKDHEFDLFKSARNFVSWIPKEDRFFHHHENRSFCGREKTLTIICNDNNVCYSLNSVIENAWILFTKKAFMHHYEKHGVDKEEFLEAFQKMENILSRYSDL